MVRELPFPGIDRDFHQREEWRGDAPSDQAAFLPPRPINDMVSVGILENIFSLARYGTKIYQAVEAAVAALRDTNEGPLEFALIITQGGRLRKLSSDGVRHSESRLFTQGFRDEFSRALGRSSRPSGLGKSSLVWTT
jgi:hypothetical protein